MGTGIVFVAAIPAYFAGGIALLFGFGWLAALGVVVAIGSTATFALGLLHAIRTHRACAHATADRPAAHPRDLLVSSQP